MGEIRIQNLDVVYKAEEGNSVLDLDLENDVDHPNDCGGNCACSTCKIIVISGSENLSEQEEEEREILEAYGWNPDEYRLACQCFIEEGGDVVLNLPNPE